jgi:putative isomerase
MIEWFKAWNEYLKYFDRKDISSMQPFEKKNFMEKLKYLIFISAILFATQCTTDTNKTESDYEQIQTRLKTGWGTFNHKSVLSHVLLPDGFAMNIGLKLRHNNQDNYLKEAFISSRDPRPETITAGYKAYDGSYSELLLEWNGIECRIESATDNSENLFLLITPLTLPDKTPSVVLEAGFLWNKPGSVRHKANTIEAISENKTTTVRAAGSSAEEYLANTSPYLAVLLDQPVAFYTGATKTLAEIHSIIQKRRKEQEAIYSKYGEWAETYAAIQSVVGWNTIYDASNDRVITPVSRIWNDNFGGQYVLFDWDTFFGAWMAGLESKELAYANAVEMIKHITPGGFIPNFAGSYGNKSFDRSQPPVGSRVVYELYKIYGDKWLLELVFDDLLTWNRWWETNRDNNGLLCWGSDKIEEPLPGNFAANTWLGAAYESGLDNSPMFDDVPFNQQTNLLELADAGLTGLYVMDCDALAQIAGALGLENEQEELTERAQKYRANLGQLWDEQAGIYKDKRTDTGEFSNRLSPTHFYPLLAKAPTQQQAERMVNEYLLNPEQFFGEWIIPSIARSDKTFMEQDYWRGRIWAPMNFLVYLGLSNYDLPEARAILVEKSNELMMQNLKLNGRIYENYNTLTGNLSDPVEGKRNGDSFYHWGALLGFIAILENTK